MELDKIAKQYMSIEDRYIALLNAEGSSIPFSKGEKDQLAKDISDLSIGADLSKDDRGARLENKHDQQISKINGALAEMYSEISDLTNEVVANGRDTNLIKKWIARAGSHKEMDVAHLTAMGILFPNDERILKSFENDFTTEAAVTARAVSESERKERAIKTPLDAAKAFLNLVKEYGEKGSSAQLRTKISDVMRDTGNIKSKKGVKFDQQTPGDKELSLLIKGLTVLYFKVAHALSASQNFQFSRYHEKLAAAEKEEADAKPFAEAVAVATLIIERAQKDDSKSTEKQS